MVEFCCNIPALNNITQNPKITAWNSYQLSMKPWTLTICHNANEKFLKKHFINVVSVPYFSVLLCVF